MTDILEGMEEGERERREGRGGFVLRGLRRGLKTGGGEGVDEEKADSRREQFFSI